MNEYEILRKFFEGRTWERDFEIINKAALPEKTKRIIKELLSKDFDKLISERTTRIIGYTDYHYNPIFGKGYTDIFLPYTAQVEDAIKTGYFNKIKNFSNDYFEHLTVLFRAYDEVYKNLPHIKDRNKVEFHDDFKDSQKIQKLIEYIFWKNYRKKYSTVKLSCKLIQNWKYFYQINVSFDNPQYICEAMRNVSADFKQVKEQGKFGTSDFMIEYKMWNPLDMDDENFDKNGVINQDNW